MPAGNDAPIGYRGACIAACVLLASLAPGCADPAPIIHYAPAENLEHVDVALIDRAQHDIDMAAYVLTDRPIMQAPTRAAAGGNKDADVMIENMKTYASNCAGAYFRTKSGTFKSLALLSGGLGECQFLTLNNTLPGVVADKKIMDRYIEIDNLPTRAEQDKEIETESATIIGTMFGIRDIVTDILWAELAKHCTYLGGKNETSEVSCK